MSVRQIPMFPLGSVLMPSMVLPLHIFEPRYREMMDAVMASEDQSFGVVLISRGHEVGGADERSMIGTLARVLEAEQSPDGRWGVVSVGTGRIRVESWLEDDPYPMAVVTDFPDESQVTDEHVKEYEQALAMYRRLLGIAAEMGHDVGPIQELSEDPVLGTFQLAATSPISTLDRYNILAAPTLDERLPCIASTLDSAIQLAELELGQAMIDPLAEDP